MVLLATGSQGGPRGAMAGISDEDHPAVKLAKGDTVIFSARPIPGNERSIGGIINKLVRHGVHVLTDRDALVHVSGHHRRDEGRRQKPVS